MGIVTELPSGPFIYARLRKNFGRKGGLES